MEFQPLKLFLFLSFPLTLSHFSSFEDPDMKKKNDDQNISRKMIKKKKWLETNHCCALNTASPLEKTANKRGVKLLSPP
jgi:hypothetical protein